MTGGRSPDPRSDGASEGAFDLLRRGVAVTPELRAGFGFSVVFALVVAAGRLVIPLAIQQVIDRGLTGPDGYRPTVVAVTCAIALTLIGLFTVFNQVTYRRLMTTAENVLMGLRTRAFDHILRLSMAHHNESFRGVMVARVTSDIETLAQFASWGAVSWVVNVVTIVTVLVALAANAWQLAVVVIVALVPVVPIMRFVQRHQLDAYDALRSRVGDTLATISETVAGADVVRGYGLVDSATAELDEAIDRQYRAQLRARFFFAIMFPVSDVFSGVTLAAVAAVGIAYGPSWGLSAGTVVSVLFLTNLVTQPVAEIGEVLDQTQTALSGWRKVLDVMATPVDLVTPEPGMSLGDGPVGVDVDDVAFRYVEESPVLEGVSLTIPAGSSLAIVGETGSGKSTLAMLMCRLADVDSGAIRLDGIDIRELGAEPLRRRVHLVPQDGFLFAGTIGDNVCLGRAGSTTDDAHRAFDELGLGWWVDSLPDGLATEVGERGGALSVGERQLVALARAELADPGLLVLDEATSSVDPETERMLSDTMVRLAGGRTVVAVAHRLSTAEAADRVAVFDRGRLVQVGSHDDLLAEDGGVYRRLHAGWVGNTHGSDSSVQSPAR